MNNKKTDLSAVHQRAMNNYNDIVSVCKEERDQCVNDIRFYFIAGAQWEGKLEEQFENKPKFEVNKTHLSIIKIINEYRNNRISVNFIPRKGKKNDKLADTLNGLFRADESDSDAHEAYDNAFEEAVGGGYGAFRLTNQYEDEYDPEDDEQRIMFEPIYEAAKSVFFDINAKKQDKSDAKHAYVVKAYSIEAYKNEFNDDPNSWPTDKEQNYDDWRTPDTVFVAEYYEVEEKTEIHEIWQDINEDKTTYTEKQFEKDPELRRKLIATGSELLKTKKVKARKIHKYLASGNKILEDLGYIPGCCIPIVPVYGKRMYINQVERHQGHVRLAKDPQRIKNMQTSKLAEISALSSVEKPIFTAEQIAGNEDMWQDDNIKNYPYLVVNPIRDKEGNEIPSQPVGYTKVPNIPPALTASMQTSDNDIKEILGNVQYNEQIKGNLSGKAIDKLDMRIDMQTHIYMSNMAKSIKRAGEIWLSMAREIYTEDNREMKTIGTQEEIGTVELNKPYLDKQTAKIEYRNDISRAKMGVTVSVGPSSESKRQATIHTIIEMMSYTQDPETLSVLNAMAIMNMEGEGLTETRKFFRNKLLQIGAVEPTEEELLIMQQQAQKNNQPDANEIYLQSAALKEQAQAQKIKADTALTIAKTQETMAETEKTRAETIETLSEIETKSIETTSSQ